MKKIIILLFFIIVSLGVVNTISASYLNEANSINLPSTSLETVTRDCYWLFDNPWNGSYEIFDCQSCTKNYVENPRLPLNCIWPPI